MSSRPQTPPYLQTALREIESPPLGGLNLASTLSTQLSDDHEADLAEEANISFLRTPIDPQGEWQAQNAAAAQGESSGQSLSSRQRLRQRMEESNAEDVLRRQRLHRVLQRLNRVHDSAYGDRTPSHNALNDWAPGSHINDDNFDEQLDEILHELRQQQPTTDPETLRSVGRTQLDIERDREYRNRTHALRQMMDHRIENASSQSLRSAAILQSVRRHPRFSARSRDYMQRYIMERERGGQHEREETPGSSNQQQLANHEAERSRYDYARSAWQSSIRNQTSNTVNANNMSQEARRSSYRRAYMENPSHTANKRDENVPNGWLESAIRYLSQIRSSDCYEDSLSEAVEGGFVTKEFFGERHEDFVLDIGTLPRPAKTSWLEPGMVFSGSQHASPPSPTVQTRNGTSTRFPFMSAGTGSTISSSDDYSRLPLFSDWITHNWSAPPSSYQPARTSSLPHTTISPLPDRWPVKVTVHTVDYDTMTLSATMEAYNVPSHPPTISQLAGNAPAKTSSITTYLEGEIIDFQDYTLLTESFASSLATDAVYWSKLEPLASLLASAQTSTQNQSPRHDGYSDTSPELPLTHALLSRAWHTHNFHQNYVLMRWKERCFVSNSTANESRRALGDDVMEIAEDGCGLTISGFYYVSLRRSDGLVEGLYYDPQSSPYQHLRLVPAGGGVGGTWSFC